MYTLYIFNWISWLLVSFVILLLYRFILITGINTQFIVDKLEFSNKYNYETMSNAMFFISKIPNARFLPAAQHTFLGIHILFI